MPSFFRHSMTISAPVNSTVNITLCYRKKKRTEYQYIEIFSPSRRTVHSKRLPGKFHPYFLCAMQTGVWPATTRKKSPGIAGAFMRPSCDSDQNSSFSSPPAALVSDALIASGVGMIFMKLLEPIMLRSGKLIAIRKRACSASTSSPVTSIS